MSLLDLDFPRDPRRNQPEKPEGMIVAKKKEADPLDLDGLADLFDWEQDDKPAAEKAEESDDAEEPEEPETPPAKPKKSPPKKAPEPKADPAPKADDKPADPKPDGDK